MTSPTHEPPGYECPFCRIAGGHLPERVVARNDVVMTIVNIKWWPNNPGGCLVVPVEHHENVFTLPPRLGTPIQAAVRDVAVALKVALGCDGVSTRQHNEPAGHQDVWHHHTHVFPRWHGDDLYGTHGSVVPMDDVVAMAERLRAHLPKQDFNHALNARPGAAAAVLRDADGRILVVEPTYRETWGLPGGGMDASESAREACEREIREELGLDLRVGELLSYEHRVNDAGVESHRFLFDGPVLTPDQIARIRLPADELRQHRFVGEDEAVALLEPPQGRRLAATLGDAGRGRALYLENGVVVPGQQGPGAAGDP